VVGTLKANKNRTVVLPEFVIDALAQTAMGKGRDDLLWPSASGGYMGPPASKESWLSGAVARCQKADGSFPRITAHALRHTAASLAISAGANPKGGAAHARPCERRDDAGCVRRLVRLRPHICRGKCGQKCGHDRHLGVHARRENEFYQQIYQKRRGASCQD
jgi:integrase